MVRLASKGAKESKQVLSKMDNIQRELNEAQEADDREAVSRLRREYSKARNEQRTLFAKLVMGDDFDVRSLYGRGTSANPSDPRWKGYSSNLMRASEIPTPPLPDTSCGNSASPTGISRTRTEQASFHKPSPA